jgi:hypothetical protein
MNRRAEQIAVLLSFDEFVDEESESDSSYCVIEDLQAAPAFGEQRCNAGSTVDDVTFIDLSNDSDSDVESYKQKDDDGRVRANQPPNRQKRGLSIDPFFMTNGNIKRYHFAAAGARSIVVAAAAAAADARATIDLRNDDDNVKIRTRPTITSEAALLAAAPMAANGVVSVDDDYDGDNNGKMPACPMVTPEAALLAAASMAADDDDVVIEMKASCSPEFQVLTFFPDASINHVRSRLAAWNQSVEAVLLEMAESKSAYPNNETQTTAATRTFAIADSVIVHMEKHAEATTSTTSNIEWMSTESFQPTSLYTIAVVQVPA